MLLYIEIEYVCRKKGTNMKRKDIIELTLSAMFIAIGLVLPFFTGQIQQIGNMLLPMHLPVMLCGLVCGWKYGLAVGLVLPLLRSLLFGMPNLFPNAVAMSFELAVYGLVIGIVFVVIKKRNILSIYISLIISMISGRIVWGIVMALLMGFAENSFTVKAFLSGALFNAIPGIIIQLILIPAIMIAIEKTKLLYFKRD